MPRRFRRGIVVPAREAFRQSAQVFDDPMITNPSDVRVRLYYVPGDPAARPQVLSAISTDGLAFTPEPGVRLDLGPTGGRDDHGMIHLSIVTTAQGGFRLYYDAVHAPRSGTQLGWGRAILSASSPDGLSFTRDPGTRVTPRMTGEGPGGAAGLPQDPTVMQVTPTVQRLLYWLPGEGTGSAVR